MKHLGRALGLSCSLASLAAYGTAPVAPGIGATPAEWMPHDIIVGLRDLPKRYSCNDLWYRFRDVLLAIGACADIQILPYRCESALGTNARSPRIYLQFQTLQALHAAQVSESDGPALKQTVRLAAGQPQSLDQGDCERLKQPKDTLLTSLNLRVVDFNPACAEPENTRAQFNLSVQALVSAEKAPLPATLHP